jgi:hypothetical protein
MSDSLTPRVPRVTVYMRAGCHLCDVARDVIAQVCDELGESFIEIDVDSDAELLAAYSDEIPVTLVDGRRHDFWRVDADRLRAALTAG